MLRDDTLDSDLTTSDVARIFKVSARTVIAWMEKGGRMTDGRNMKLKGYRLGIGYKERRFKKKDVLKFAVDSGMECMLRRPYSQWRLRLSMLMTN